jgi:hypothetical protein
MAEIATLNAVNGNNIVNEYDVSSSQFSGSDTGLLASTTYWVNVTVQNSNGFDSFWVSAITDANGNLAWSLPGNLGNLADGSYTVNAATYASAPVNGQPQGTALVGTSYTSPNLTIDTRPPTDTSVIASGSGVDANGNGLVTTGKTVTFTVYFSENVTVNTSGGAPTLTLNDGGVAIYKSGSGTNALTFSYTAQSGQNAADLAVTALNLNSATITDGAGNNAVLPAQPTSISGTLEVNTSGNNEIAGNFNGTSVKPGNVIWFTAVLSAGGSPGNETFTFNGSHIYLTNGTTIYDIVVPNAVVTYSNTVMVCGPRERANSITSLSFAFAAAMVHVLALTA